MLKQIQKQVFFNDASHGNVSRGKLTTYARFLPQKHW